MKYLCVLDAASIRFVKSADGTYLRAETATGESLAEICPQSADLRGKAFEAMDAALAQGRVTRTHPDDPTRQVRMRIAIYNPDTAVVAVAPIPDTSSYADAQPLAIPAGGATAVLTEDVLRVGSRTLCRVAASRRDLRTADDLIES